MALMVMSCCGSLLGWQFTMPRCLNLHLMKATSLKFSPVYQSGCTGAGNVDHCDYPERVALMTISPSLNSQFNVLVNLAW